MKKIAFFGIAVSTVATITAIIAIPMLYSYMHHIQASLEVEVDFCQMRTGGLFDEFEKVLLKKHSSLKLTRLLPA